MCSHWPAHYHQPVSQLESEWVNAGSFFASEFKFLLCCQRTSALSDCHIQRPLHGPGVDFGLLASSISELRSVLEYLMFAVDQQGVVSSKVGHNPPSSGAQPSLPQAGFKQPKCVQTRPSDPCPAS
ncbi:hypothetical protein O6H91_20G062600 [Diphasiastrum complanatum]|uniref:Uncharacterized protein n=1 Tax=Diphasiastrum complanatum TaxID=34168 RepID=A0ACC2ARB5_DIPCM|nr:hypothetical protein O6H91_20G062600 [Diphasiastrum complanatum]